MNRFRRLFHSDHSRNRPPVPSGIRRTDRFAKSTLSPAIRAMAPTLLALSLTGVAHAQGTMDFSGATTLMNTFKTFAIYAGAVICFGGLIFAGIRMMSGRFQFTAPDKDLGVANRDLATIDSIGADRHISARLDSGRQIEFDPAEHRHFDYGYAVTSHSSQGLTAERVLVNADTRVHPDLLNSRFGYVSVSRGSHDVQIFTNDAVMLSEVLSRDVSKTSAINLSANEQSNIEIALVSSPR